MGKRIRIRKRGRGSPSYLSPGHRFAGVSQYRTYDEKDKSKVKAQVINIIDDPGRSSLLGCFRFEDGEDVLIPIAEGLKIGDTIEEGASAELKIGSILPLSSIPEGYPVFNIESRAGDGGKIARASGQYAYIITKSGKKVLIKLPSKKSRYFDNTCRATIGCISGGGRVDKPLLKAGASFYKRGARNQYWPTSRGVHMNSVSHPFGGKGHHGNKTIKGKGGSPGQHVGSFGASRTGRRRGQMQK